ncbi:PGAP1-domain-containing protein [Auriculariales sp. MPI-PUGE-AT-0066]|nr:PGAP1-domain-containing protein [Auriculariales sp. MPI-PUGE-AT-0066]
MSRTRSILATVLAAAITFVAYNSAVKAPELLAPEGCRMSYMWPSYILQTAFDKSWTSYASRYSLWLYREAGWDAPDKLRGVPVLFVPGNAGSSRQARSIASSATHQYFTSKGVRSSTFATHYKPLDVFTAEFNEDLSALHGPTLVAQSRFVSDAVKFILSHYDPGTQIILMGHSMGGIVAMSLLPSPNISAIITMSTPHSLPPARLDRRIEDIFAASWHATAQSKTPVISICGGATDSMIPSESCYLPNIASDAQAYRRTVFTSGMEGVWTGVGHQSMVWCHQVRWHVARAALLTGGSPPVEEIHATFDRWFRIQATNMTSTKEVTLDLGKMDLQSVTVGEVLRLHPPATENSAFTFKVPASARGTLLEFTLLASGATVLGLGALTPGPTEIRILSCTTADTQQSQCIDLKPTSLRLLPSTRWGHTFPVAKEGAGESEGIVSFRTIISANEMAKEGRHLVLKVDSGFPRSWILASLAATSETPILYSTVTIDSRRLVQDVILNRTPTSLFAYRFTSHLAGQCDDSALFPPLLLHEASDSESHFYSLQGGAGVSIHSHSHGPFLPRQAGHERSRLTIISPSTCGVARIQARIDWYASIGQWALRFWGAVATWAIGIVALVCLHSWWVASAIGEVPDFLSSLERIAARYLPLVTVVLCALSLLPLPPQAILGFSGSIEAALFAPLVLLIAFTYVFIVASFTSGLTFLLGLFKRRSLKWCAGPESKASTDTRQAPPAVTLGRIASISVILLLVAFVVPYQVAYVVALVDFIWSCAQLPNTPQRASVERQHVLVLLLVLLPLQAPVLPVWVRTLLTAGWTAPFDGDHNILLIAPSLMLAGFAPSNPRAPLWTRSSLSRLEVAVTTALLGLLVAYPLLFGLRWMFGVYEMANVLASWLVITLHLPLHQWISRNTS